MAGFTCVSSDVLTPGCSHKEERPRWALPELCLRFPRQESCRLLRARRGDLWPLSPATTLLEGWVQGPQSPPSAFVGKQ